MQATQKSSHRLALGVLTALAVTAAAACGGGGKSAGDNAAAPVASATKAAGAASPTQAPAAATASPIKLVAINILFDKQQLSAPAGAVTIDVDNQDAGIPHNIHMFNGMDAAGPSLAATAIEAGPSKQSLKLDLGKGQYFYQCDVHPTTMTGTITVS